jgi:signal peptidase I
MIKGSKVMKKNIKAVLSRLWKFIWHEDSIWSWIVNIVIAFVLIKFIIYPGIGLLLGTNLPVVAVISESMSHRATPVCQMSTPTGMCTKYYDNKFEICGKIFDKRMSFNDAQYWETCGNYYENRSITSEEFKGFSMHNGFNKGDIIILKGVTFEDLHIGDILVYQSKLSYPVIHRVVAKNDIVETKGDHNSMQIQEARLNEKYITKDQIIGKAWIKVPYLGYVKIIFSEAIQCVTFNGCSFG